MKCILPLRIFFSFLVVLSVKAYSQDNVGIGTTTPVPGAILELQSSDQGFLMVRLNAGDTATYPALAVEGMSFYAQDVNRLMYYDGSNWQSVAFGEPNYWRDNGGDIYPINSDGVVIGANTTGLKFQVIQNLASVTPVMGIENQSLSGDVSYGLRNSGSGTSYTYGIDASDGNKFKISNASILGSNDRIVLSGSNVGIGTAGPVNRLDVNGGMAIGSGYAGSTSAFANGLIVEGDVGFGATTQIGSGKFIISEVTTGFSGMYINTSAGGEPFYGYAQGGSAVGWTYVDGGDANKWKLNLSGVRMAMTTGGLLGIGTTTPVNRLDVEGGMAIGSSYSGTSLAPTNGLIVQGNVGIGQTSSSYPLTVNGQGYFTGSVGIGTTPTTNDLYVQSGSSSSIVVNGFNSSVLSSGFSGSSLTIGSGTGFYGTTEWRMSSNTGGFLIIGQQSVNQALYFTRNSSGIAVMSSSHFGPYSNAGLDLGVSSYRWDRIYYTTGILGTSDKRMKKNIRSLDYGLEEIMALRPVDFEWRDFEDRGKEMGFIAQDLQQVLPEMITEADDEEKTLLVNQMELLPVLVKAIQEQQERIEDLEKQVKSMNKGSDLRASLK